MGAGGQPFKPADRGVAGTVNGTCWSLPVDFWKDSKAEPGALRMPYGWKCKPSAFEVAKAHRAPPAAATSLGRLYEPLDRGLRALSVTSEACTPGARASSTTDWPHVA